MTAVSLAQQVWELSRLALADEDGCVAVIRVFMDESGVHDGSPIVTVAAYLGRPEHWCAWTQEWKRALYPTGVKVYHAVDAQNLAGEFSGWTPDRVAELAKKLLPIIANGNIAGIAVGMDLRVFDAALKGRDDLKAVFGDPYVACAQWAIQIILNIAADTGNTARIAFVHETNNYHAQVYDAFEWIKKNTVRGDNLISLSFGKKKDYPPLQAADILAYEANKRLRNISAPARRPWDALRANTFAATYVENNMDYLVKTLEKLKEGHYDEISRGMGWNRAWTAPVRSPAGRSS